jgi:hypothetical protein
MHQKYYERTEGGDVFDRFVRKSVQKLVSNSLELCEVGFISLRVQGTVYSQSNFIASSLRKGDSPYGGYHTIGVCE